jgi:hypothetical protein
VNVKALLVVVLLGSPVVLAGCVASTDESAIDDESENLGLAESELGAADSIALDPGAAAHDPPGGEASGPEPDPWHARVLAPGGPEPDPWQRLGAAATKRGGK